MESEKYMKDKKSNGKKSKYEIFRRIMLSIFIFLFVCFFIQFSVLIFKYIQARNVSGEAISGIESIIKPSESIPVSTDPIIIDPSTDPEGSETGEDAPGESQPDSTVTNPPEHAYSEYFSQWQQFIRDSKKKYPDLVGYIEIENLDMLYPIVQAEDNAYYLDHLIDGTRNNRGEIFLDYRNNGDNIIDNSHIILYGHNLADGTKFHPLTDLRDAENFYNSPVNIITEDGIFTFTIFSFYRTDKDSPYTIIDFESSQKFALFCTMEQANSMHESNFEFRGKEIVLTMSTCVNDLGGRWCTHAVLTNITR